MDEKWHRFERLVAAIQHSLAGTDAEITWNDDIGGRQFDVTIRFSSVAYNYLTVVEAKDFVVPVEKVEAFATKARRYGANKAVIVSSEGFQSGAVDAAKSENIELFTLKEAEAWPPWVALHEERAVLGITNVELLAQDGTVQYRFSNEANYLAYFGKHVIFHTRHGSETLEETIHGHRHEWEAGVSEKSALRMIKMSRGAIARIPFVDPIKPALLRFAVRLDSAVRVDTKGWDPAMIPRSFAFVNVITGESKLIGELDVWLGIDTTIAPGRFYLEPLKSFKYYCEEVADGLATYVLLESYQHGRLFQATIKQQLEGRFRVIEIRDDVELKRLRRMYNWFRWRRESRAEPRLAHIGRNTPCPCGSSRPYKSCHGGAG